MSEQCEGMNQITNTEYTRAGYTSKVTKYTDDTKTRSSFIQPQSRPNKGSPNQNHQASVGTRSTASSGTKNSDLDLINKILSKQDWMRRICEEAYSWCRLAAYIYKDYKELLTKEPIRTMVWDMQLQHSVGETRVKEKHKQQPTVGIMELLDPNRVCVNMNV